MGDVGHVGVRVPTSPGRASCQMRVSSTWGYARLTARRCSWLCASCDVVDSGARAWRGSGGRPCLRLGHPLVDRSLEFVAARVRANTTRATASDLKVFFSIVAKQPVEVTHADVLGFIVAQRGDRAVAPSPDSAFREVSGASIGVRHRQRRSSARSRRSHHSDVRRFR